MKLPYNTDLKVRSICKIYSHATNKRFLEKALELHRQDPSKTPSEYLKMIMDRAQQLTYQTSQDNYDI
jgi:hypothetical protein